MVTSPPKIESLKHALGKRAAAVAFQDMDRVGANPALIIPAWRRFVDDRGKGTTGIRGVGEPISAARSGAELVECQLHEALLNVAFAEVDGFRLACPYDTERLAPRCHRGGDPQSSVSHPTRRYRGQPNGTPRRSPIFGARFRLRPPEPRP